MIDRRSIEDVFGEPISISDGKNRSSEYRFNCPFCIDNRGDADTKGHLFVNDRYGIYHCYRCGAKGKINPELPSGYSRDELVDNSQLLKQLLSIVGDDSALVDMVIPRKKASEDKYAIEYLHSRGLTDDQIDFYDIRVGGILSNLLGYVIIPNIVRKGVMTDMYCSRSFTGQSPKYINPTDGKTSQCVFNLHRIEDNPEEIIICEGAFDAMSAGTNAIALYGKECSNIKLSKILAKRPKKIVINLDLDAKNKAYDLANMIKRRDPTLEVRILLIDMDGVKDASDFLSQGRIDEYHQMVKDAPIFDPLVDGLSEVLKRL